YGTRQVETAQGEILSPTYLGEISLDGQTFSVPVVAGSAFQQVLLGIPWLRTRRLVVDLPSNILTLG
ncbi:aspartyl protease, partial [Pseudanabaenaceae cyanobacterium LEGE 13415]|nr:aspartyl protease [Pseudanabaenaceae cyanobacterium LEGE 13415]